MLKEFLKRKWFIGVNEKRFRIPLSLSSWYRFIPQPRWLKRWYFKKSFQWWEHPSNHHWKMFTFDSEDLRVGERDLWSGTYRYGDIEESACPFPEIKANKPQLRLVRDCDY